MTEPLDVCAVDQVCTDQYAIYQGDACELIAGIPTGSIHYGIHSPPFEGLYKFSNFDRDLSNREGDAFWQHYAFLIRELYRVTMPGRLHSVHVMQLATSKIRFGHIGMRDFRGEVVRAYCGDEDVAFAKAIEHILERIDALEREGGVTGLDRLREIARRLGDEREEDAARRGAWIFHSEVCIWKDPVAAQARTKSIRLLHKQVMKDSSLSGQGLADYVLSFRKPGDNPEAISGAFESFVGEGLDLSREAYEHDIATRRAAAPKPSQYRAWPYDQWVSISVWQRYASPVWMDIRQTRTLQNRRWNPAAQDERDENDEQHISPLQLDVIERCVDLWSMPGETVLTPFLGIGSEVWAAVNMGRRGVGFELKPSYFAQAARNLRERPTVADAEEPLALDLGLPMAAAAE